MTDTAKTQATQQVEAARFRSAISESLLQQMQGNINFLLSVALPVGSCIDSMLTESQFQDEVGPGWILADGRNVAASAYAALTGYTTVPDLRGVFIRGKNNGRSGASGNPDGDLALGSTQVDQLGSHSHNITTLNIKTEGGASENSFYFETDSGTNWGYSSLHGPVNTNAAGGNETRPRNVTMNRFIRID